MKLNEMKPKAGSVKRRKRLGRGNASGHGTFSGRGCKGQGQRKSGNVRPGFEGGQTPLINRLPKLRGFKNPVRIDFQIVNVGNLNDFKDGEEVNIQTLLAKGLVSRKDVPVKALGNGKLTSKIVLKVQKASKTAKAKIVAAGGKIL
ncbi:50S ribosomal protein L15 [Patescibacteria group bacterium]|nr:50S ribosomal protein L15 [Patescibacteria group bacterium]MBU1016444.1 50S ribosomal protein L15 [Patescibacteria group bacterium]MBU1684942.1 50S ribosomal protein L15 [Patescibacteria group bacterium]MBU1939030.1 50S ribosomal protein L15 [Patescibacteria group bacterium]